MDRLKYVIERLKLQFKYGSPAVRAENGIEFSTLTGQGPAQIEVNWEKLQADIESFEKDFQENKEPNKDLLVRQMYSKG